MALGISLRKLSRRTGRDKDLLFRWAKKGAIPKLSDGTFDEAAVRKAIAENVEATTTEALTEGVSALTESTPVRSTVNAPETGGIASLDDAREAVSLVRQVLAEEGVPVETMGLVAARTAETILRARERAVNLAKARGDLVEIEAVGEAVEASYARCRARLLAIPGNLAQALTNEPNPAVVRDRIFGEVSKALTELSTSFGDEASAA